MCEYCDLLQHITMNSKFSTRKRTTECRACAATDDEMTMLGLYPHAVDVWYTPSSIKTHSVGGGIRSNRQLSHPSVTQEHQSLNIPQSMERTIF